MTVETLHPTRRRYTPEFRQQLIDESNQPGVTVLSVAEKHGVGAATLHAWRFEDKRAKGGGNGALNQSAEIRRLKDRIVELEAAYGRLALECDGLRLRLRKYGHE